MTGDDPLQFAKSFESSLQELTDGGYDIVNQIGRGNAVIITGRKVEMSDGFFQKAPPPPPPHERRRMVPQSTRPTGSTTEEVLYHYIADGKTQQKAFPSLVEALRAVKAHMDAPMVAGVSPVCPVSIVTVSMTKFELPMFSTLLKAFSDDLHDEDKPLG